MPDAPSPLSYREAYTRLSRIAAELESGEADLDRVLPLLEEARAAYAACRERIEAVRSVLTGEWTVTGAGGEDDGDPDDGGPHDGGPDDGSGDDSGNDPYADPY